MDCSTNLRNTERSRLCRSTEPLKSDMVLSFSASKKTRRKLWEHQRESFFLACKSMSQPGMAPVWSHAKLWQQRNKHWHCTLVHRTFIFQRPKVRMSFVPWMRGSTSFILRPLGRYLSETWRRPPLTTTFLTSFSALVK